MRVDLNLWLVWIKASAHSFKRFTSRLLKLSFSLSMHLLPRMNVMLDFIWMLPVQLRGTVGFDPSTPMYKSDVLTTRPQLAWYEIELNSNEIYKYTIYK